MREKRGGREKTSKQKGEREGERLCVCWGRKGESKQASEGDRERERGREKGREGGEEGIKR